MKQGKRYYNLILKDRLTVFWYSERTTLQQIYDFRHDKTIIQVSMYIILKKGAYLSLMCACVLGHFV